MAKMYKPFRFNKKRRNIRRKKVGKKNVVKRLRTSQQGYININRRLDMIASYATPSGAPGTITILPAAQTCLTYGVPTNTVGGLSSVYDVPFSFQFRLDQLRSYSDFTNLFDQYKINGAMVKIRSYANKDETGGFPIPWIEYWNDHDDATIPLGAVDLAREHMGVKIKYFGASTNHCTLMVKPKPLFTVLRADGASTAVAAGRGGWLNCASPSIPHFAIKGIIHNYQLPGGPIQAGLNSMQFDVTVNVSFKDVQ